jgi:hypothetical protein
MTFYIDYNYELNPSNNNEDSTMTLITSDFNKPDSHIIALIIIFH